MKKEELEFLLKSYPSSQLGREDLPLEEWNASLGAGTWINAKHNPNCLQNPHEKNRSVIACEWLLSEKWRHLINDLPYVILKLKKNNRCQSYYAVLIPEESGEPIPASGVPAWQTTPTYTLDSLIMASGAQYGWHVYGQHYSVLEMGIKDGTIHIEGYFMPETPDNDLSFLGI